MPTRLTRFVPALASLGTLLLGAHASKGDNPLPFKIGEETARRLAIEAYDHGMNPELFSYDHSEPPFFVIYGVNPPSAEGGFGFFAVNPWTGDVWDLWECRKLSTPALRRSQAIIRRRFTRDEMAQYSRLAAIKPDCD